MYEVFYNNIKGQIKDVNQINRHQYILFCQNWHSQGWIKNSAVIEFKPNKPLRGGNDSLKPIHPPPTSLSLETDN